MGQIFTYYKQDDHFAVTTLDTTGLYSFTLISQNLQLSDISISSPFVGSQQSDGLGNYHLTFNYKPDGVATVNTFNNTTIFTVTSSAIMSSGVIVNWTTNTNNDTYPYSDPYNSMAVSYAPGNNKLTIADIDARINSYNGQINSSTLKKSFGQTLIDRSVSPNILQTSVYPTNVDTAMSSIQNYNFILNANAISVTRGSIPALAANSTLSIVPDLTLTSGKHYQFTTNLTIILRASNETTYISGYYTISGAAKDTSLLGNTGYMITSISKNTNMDTYIPNSAISLSITSNKFQISVTPITTILFSIDLLANTTITSSIYSSAIF